MIKPGYYMHKRTLSISQNVGWLLIGDTLLCKSVLNQCNSISCWVAQSHGNCLIKGDFKRMSKDTISDTQQ